MYRYYLCCLGFIIVILSSGCSTGKTPSSQPFYEKPFLMLTQAQFKQEKNADGSTNPVPGAARLELVYPSGNTWKSVVIEDPESNVFHKAIVFKPEGSKPGILTIGANKALLKLWRPVNGKWIAETLWSISFGGQQDRLRDIEIGDVTGDGKNDLVIATHDQGVVAVLQNKNGTWEATELDRTPSTFVHEIEIGDVDGDGKNEFFATPSAPNKLDGTPQPGIIVMYKYEDGEFVRHVVEEFPTRHVKEILTADLYGQGHADLYASIEAEMKKVPGGSTGSGSVEIKRYHWEDGDISSEPIGTLMDLLCRFLVAADVTGDGNIELIASPLKSGVWVFTRGKNRWKKDQITAESSGFEHATLITDIDGDGKKEIYVAADDQRQLQRFIWDGQVFEKSVIYPIEDNRITFGVTAGVLK